MRTVFFGFFAVLALAEFVSTTHAQDKETSAEKIRKVLEVPITLNFTGRDLQDIANQLKKKTDVNFVVDPTFTAPPNAQVEVMMAPGFNPGAGMIQRTGQVELKSERVKLRQALQRFLRPHHMTFVVMEDSVLITSTELAATRQLGQRTDVNVEKIPIQKALKDLSRTYGLNLVVDPRVDNKEVTLALDDVTVETAVNVLTELGGLKSVRMNNVLYVTTEAHADKLRKEQPPATPYYGYPPYGITTYPSGYTVPEGPPLPGGNVPGNVGPPVEAPPPLPPMKG